jgi:hypothetical protein
MSVKTTFSIRGRNPDVLTCIANLSNDEVFTPPEFANKMLDTVAEAWAFSNGGEDIFSNPEIKFLDPFTKSGVFLREITSRLTQGLEEAIPDLSDRVDHILTKQVFGIGVTELTSQLSRRSLYCSKLANGEHSIAKSFTKPDGNIWFERTEHVWAGGAPSGLKIMNDEGETVDQLIGEKCKMCGASKTSLDRGDDFETHAYALLHTDDINNLISEIFGEDMHFDVIIGNPPYQLDDGGFGASAAPIYNKFVDNAKALDPRLLCMVIPARWFVGGKGLDSFREEMLNDSRIRSIQDFPDSSDVFPGVQIKGGVCYFLWDRDNSGDCTVTTNYRDAAKSEAVRPMLEPGADVFIRYNEALPILRKIAAKETGDTTGRVDLPLDKAFISLVSSSKPFGLRTYFQGHEKKQSGDVLVYQNGGHGYFPRSEVLKNVELIDSWKVFISRAYGAGETFPHAIIGKPFVGEPGSISTETYMCIGPLKSRAEADNVVSYIQTRLMRFLVLLHKPSQDATRSVYSFVPVQDFSKPWTDEMLYTKYGISKQEQSFIESLIRPMTLEGDAN